MPQTMTFGSLEVAYDARLLRPRPWTAQQSRWAVELLAAAPPGPVLELCSGAGQIGLYAVALAPRRLVCVDRSPVACGYVRRNAEAAGLADLVEVRESGLEEALEPAERFALVLADPPWVPSAETCRFAEDPPETIDGGPDGLSAARACLRVARPHLLPGGSILLQLGGRDQVALLRQELQGLVLQETRDGEGGVLVRLGAVP